MGKICIITIPWLFCILFLQFLTIFLFSFFLQDFLSLFLSEKVKIYFLRTKTWANFLVPLPPGQQDKFLNLITHPSLPSPLYWPVWGWFHKGLEFGVFLRDALSICAQRLRPTFKRQKASQKLGITLHAVGPTLWNRPLFLVLTYAEMVV